MNKAKVTPTSEYIIDVVGLSKTFRKHPAVLDVTLKVKPGEIFGFLGPNGTGKTTTIRMLSGLIKPDSGKGYCLGYDVIREANLIKSHVGYMTQYFSLYGKLTVEENLILHAKIYGLLHYRPHMENLMHQLGLSSRRHQLASSLSGGWKQRLSLAAALIHNPLLLLLDEPTAGTDASARRTFWEIIYNLSAQGVTVLLSSHDLSEVTRCHRIAYMSYGKTIMSGTVEEIVEQVGLSTYRVRGENLQLLMQQLKEVPEVEMVSFYNEALHVCGLNKEILERATEPYRQLPNYHWEMVRTNLDDVFVYLVSKKRDTRYER